MGQTVIVASGHIQFQVMLGYSAAMLLQISYKKFRPFHISIEKILAVFQQVVVCDALCHFSCLVKHCPLTHIQLYYPITFHNP